jgi:hypothetical protein
LFNDAPVTSASLAWLEDLEFTRCEQPFHRRGAVNDLANGRVARDASKNVRLIAAAA